MTETDQQLLDQLRTGNTAAFAALFERHYAPVYRVLYGLVGTREEAEDLAQETFLALYHHPPRLDADAGLLAWLCRVALNRGYNALRSQRRQRQRLERVAEPPTVFDPQAEVLRNEDRDAVRSVLARLPERQARLLLLRHAGLAYAEIAAVLEIAPGSIGTLLSRAERAFLAAYEIDRHEPHGSLDTSRP